jgi:hypothetical protein
MRIGEIFRYPSTVTLQESIDYLPNWYFRTRAPEGKNWNAVKLDRGINSSAVLPGSTQGIPYIAIRSSPHRFGSSITPWEDIHRPDQGYSRYFGDNKPGLKDANEAQGNVRMLEAFVLQSGSKENRLQAPPILVFEGAPYDGRIKGQVIFHGVGVITKAELVVQRDPKSILTFSNYVFDIALLDLSNENESLNWLWINSRRDPSISVEESLRLAPSAWKKWVSLGPAGVPRLRRNVISRNVVPEELQRPAPNSEEDKILKALYNNYHGKKIEFESLAEFVTQQIFIEQGLKYSSGWITQGSSDGGIDFVSSIDLDPVGVIGSSRQVILGQAKCEKLNTPTNGIHIARLAARLRRGWIGVYVTTSYFSTQVQKEILIDRYPIVLVDGLRVATVVRKYLLEHGMELPDLLSQLSQTHASKLGFGDPDSILN